MVADIVVGLALIDGGVGVAFVVVAAAVVIV